VILTAVFTDIERKLTDAIQAALRALGAEVKVLLEQPKQGSFGELAIPVAFQLARQLKRPPKHLELRLHPRIP
jgi:arginyl-tRNA synthetase